MKPLHPVVSCRKTEQKDYPWSDSKKLPSFVRTMGFSHYWKSHSATDKFSLPISKVSSEIMQFQTTSRCLLFPFHNRQQVRVSSCPGVFAAILSSVSMPLQPTCPFMLQTMHSLPSRRQCNRATRIAFNYLGSHNRNLLKSYYVWPHFTSSERM